MRPKLFTFRNFLLALAAIGIFGGLAFWGSLGFPLPGQGVPSTAGKLLFLSSNEKSAEVQMLSADGNAVSLTPSDTGVDEPAFSKDGTLAAFTAEREGVRQLCLVEAAPGRKRVTLTRTSGTKQSPVFVGSDRVFYLQSGKISAINTDASDPLAIFPTAEAMNQNGMLKAMFREGGIKRFTVSPDGKRVAAAVNREKGQILVLHEQAASQSHEDEGATVILGMAESIIPQFLPDGTLVVLFAGGSPFGQAMALPGAAAAGSQSFEDMDLQIPTLPDELAKLTALVQFDSQMKPVGQMPLPVKASALAISGESHRVAFTGTDEKGNSGLIAFELSKDKQPEPKVIFNKPCQNPTWSPDGSQIAFSDGADIFVAPGDGSEPAKNLTNGKYGKATQPVWSFAPKDKK